MVRGVAAICALAFLTLVIVVATGRPWFDLAIAEWTANHRTSAGIDVADALSIAGSVVGIVPLGLVVAYVVYRRHGWGEAKWMFVACCGASLLYLAVNVVFRSARPPMPLRVMDSAGWSFPSGHSTQAIVFWPMSALVLGYRWLLVPAAIIVAAIGGSRIYLDEHWTTDVASGFLLGATWLATVLALRRTRTYPRPR